MIVIWIERAAVVGVAGSGGVDPVSVGVWNALAVVVVRRRLRAESSPVDRQPGVVGRPHGDHVFVRLTAYSQRPGARLNTPRHCVALYSVIDMAT